MQIQQYNLQNPAFEEKYIHISSAEARGEARQRASVWEPALLSSFPGMRMLPAS